MQFADLTEDEQAVIKTTVTEKFLSYMFLRQAGKQHADLRTDLQNNYTGGDDRYPDTRQTTLHVFDRYVKTPTQTVEPSQGGSFTQMEKKNNVRSKGEYDKELWKHRTCFGCNKKGHPSYACPHAKGDGKSQKSKDADDKSTASGVKFDLSDSDDEEGSNHFQVGTKIGRRAVQFTQLDNGKFELRIQRLFKQSQSKRPKDINLREVFLLDSQSTIDLICNQEFATEIWHSKKGLHLSSNGGTMNIKQKCSLKGYHQEVWFDTRAITNIIALANMEKQYRVT